jgi:hypothetical protein
MVTAFCCLSAAAQESLLLQGPAIGQNEHAPNLNWNFTQKCPDYISTIVLVITRRHKAKKRLQN